MGDQGIVLGSRQGTTSKVDSPCNREGERRFLELVAAARLGDQTARAVGYLVARGPLSVDELGLLMTDRTAAQAALRAMYAVGLVEEIANLEEAPPNPQEISGQKRGRSRKKSHTPEVYRLKREALLVWFRQPQIVRLASREGESSIAGDIMKDLLVAGKSTKLQLLENHPEALVAGIASPDEAFETLLRKQLITELKSKLSGTSNANGKTGESSGDDEDALFPLKRPRVATDGREEALGLQSEKEVAGDDDEKYFIPNFEQFRRYLLSDFCVELAAYRLDDCCAAVLRALLSLSYLNRSGAGSMVQEESILEGVRLLVQQKQAPAMDLAKVSSCLVMMSRPQYLYVTSSELDGKVYTPNIQQMTEIMQKKTAEELIGKTYGLGARRIFNQLLFRPRIEQKQVADGALLPLKATREIMSRLLGARLLSLQEVPQGRNADYKLSRSFFLFYVDMEQVKTTILELCYKSCNNIIERKKHEAKEDNRRDLASAKSAATKEGGKHDIVPSMIDVLDRSLLQLDRTMCVLRDF